MNRDCYVADSLHPCQSFLVPSSLFVRTVLCEPASVKRLTVHRHKLLPIANFPCNYRFGRTVKVTDYPVQQNP